MPDKQLARLDLERRTDTIQRIEVDPRRPAGAKRMRGVVGHTGTLGQCFDRQAVVFGDFANPHTDRHAVLHVSSASPYSTPVSA
jgi:hypothetical protein